MFLLYRVTDEPTSSEPRRETAERGMRGRLERQIKSRADVGARGHAARALHGSTRRCPSVCPASLRVGITSYDITGDDLPTVITALLLVVVHQTPTLLRTRARLLLPRSSSLRYGMKCRMLLTIFRLNRVLERHPVFT